MLGPIKNVCPQCGSTYTKFCFKCRRENTAENNINLLEEQGMHDAELIRLLVNHIKDGNVQCLFKAIELKGMNTPTKIEATGAGGGPLEFVDVKDRIPGLLSRLRKAVNK